MRTEQLDTLPRSNGDIGSLCHRNGLAVIQAHSDLQPRLLIGLASSHVASRCAAQRADDGPDRRAVALADSAANKPACDRAKGRARAGHGLGRTDHHVLHVEDRTQLDLLDLL